MCQAWKAECTHLGNAVEVRVMKTAQSCEWTADGWNCCNVAVVIYVPAVAISALFADKSAKTLFAVLSKLQIISVN